MTLGLDPQAPKRDPPPALPRVVGNVRRTGLTGNVTATTLWTAPVSAHYRASVSQRCTTISGAGAPTVATTIRWTDNSGARNVATGNLSLAALGENALVYCFECVFGQAITWETAIAAAAGNPVYEVAVTLEVMS